MKFTEETRCTNDAMSSMRINLPLNGSSGLVPSKENVCSVTPRPFTESYNKT